MRGIRNFLLVMMSAAGLLLGGCGSDNPAATNPKPSGKYLYVNHDASTNYVSGFAIQTDGTLVELTGSPYVTGGAAAGGYFAANRIALATGKNLLFASNVADSTISVFSVNELNGTLTQVGVPVASGATMSSSGSLAVSNDEKFLFVAHTFPGAISAFAISSNGALTPVTGSPFSIGSSANGITLNVAGSVLYVADGDANTLVALSVAADGSLSPIAGSPFAYSDSAGGIITSFALGSSTMGISAATGGVLSSYSLDAIGAPTLLNTLITGGVGQAVSTARNGSLAILSGGFGSNISVVNVATDGTLTHVTGSPFATAAQTRGYAVANPQGTFLYASESDRVEGFSIDANGALTSLGTIMLTNPGGARSLVIY